MARARRSRVLTALAALALLALAAPAALAQPSEGSEYTYKVTVKADYSGEQGDVTARCEAVVRAVVSRVTEEFVEFTLYLESHKCEVTGGDEGLVRRVESEIVGGGELRVGVEASREGVKVRYPRGEAEVDPEEYTLPLYVDPRLLEDGRLSNSSSISFLGITIEYSYDLRYDDSGVLEEGRMSVDLSAAGERVSYEIRIERPSFGIPAYALVIAAAVALAAFTWFRSRT